MVKNLRARVADAVESAAAAQKLLDYLYGIGRDHVSDSAAYDFVTDGEECYRVTNTDAYSVTVEDPDGIPYVIPTEDIDYVEGDTATVGYHLADASVKFNSKFFFMKKLADGKTHAGMLNGKPIILKQKIIKDKKTCIGIINGKPSFTIQDNVHLSHKVWEKLKSTLKQLK